MKVNKIFHWLYFLVLLLPVFVIPIFAIYTRNESNTFENNIELQVEQNKVVDFNQVAYYPSDSDEHVLYTNIPTQVEIINNNTLQINLPSGYTNPQVSYLNLEKGTYFYRFSWSSTASNPFLLRAYNYSDNSSIFYRQLTNSYYENIDTFSNNFNLNFTFNINPPLSEASTELLIKLNIFNLTKMFGSGNEPTIEQFKQWYPKDYYSYTQSEKQLLKNYSVETLNNTDIGSQFLYSVYKPVNDYFNFDNVFNFGQLYDWLQLNFFNGNAPLGFFVFWHLLIYWLLTSLLWLLFDVLIYVPKLIHRWLDKADIA